MGLGNVLRGLFGRRSSNPVLEVDECAQVFVSEKGACRASRIGERSIHGGYNRNPGGYRMSSDGTTMRSFDQEIARWVSPNVIEIECRQFSMTSAKHQGAVRFAVSHHNRQLSIAAGRDVYGRWDPEKMASVGADPPVPGIAITCKRLPGGATYEDDDSRRPAVRLLREDVTDTELWRRETWGRTRTGKPKVAAGTRRLRERFNVAMKEHRRQKRANARWRREVEALRREWFATQQFRIRYRGKSVWDFVRDEGVATDPPHPYI